MDLISSASDFELTSEESYINAMIMGLVNFSLSSGIVFKAVDMSERVTASAETGRSAEIKANHNKSETLKFILDGKQETKN